MADEEISQCMYGGRWFAGLRLRADMESDSVSAERGSPSLFLLGACHGVSRDGIVLPPLSALLINWRRCVFSCDCIERRDHLMGEKIPHLSSRTESRLEARTPLVANPGAVSAVGPRRGPRAHPRVPTTPLQTTRQRLLPTSCAYPDLQLSRLALLCSCVCLSIRLTGTPT